MDAREQLTEILEQLKQINRRLVDLEQRTEDIGASQQQIAKRVEETLNERFETLRQENDRRFEELKERLSLQMDYVAFLRTQVIGTATPKPVERVASGHSLVEPSGTFRRARPYRR
ncbi:MAG: hypothetical protein M3495_14175 [Pseudomonadota bacterium]|nr:hypothetical protein [Gammaproteobacteria bacterium]MDQ3582670.1 hypothetical protein [Pseudomonadota bacterium]